MYRKVDTRIWNDEKFCSLTDDGKLVFLMLLTHHNMTQLGAMKASVAGLAEELGWALNRFQKAFTPSVACGMVEHDPRACLIYLPNFIKYNKPESPNVVKAWVKASALLPECTLRSVVLETAKAFLEGLSEGYQQAFLEESLKAYPCPLANQKQKQKQKEKNLDQDANSVGTCTQLGAAV
jgi:hypothetical protein